MKKINGPYSDDYMIYDGISGRYVLTEKALLERAGVSLRARISANAYVSPETVINSFNRTVSDMI